MKNKDLFEELKRRNVYKVGIAYVITAWLIAQVASLAATTFEAPHWVMKMVLILLVIGFPIALLFAWAYESTPKGIKKTEELDVEQGINEQRPTWPLVNNLVMVVLYLLVVGQFTYNQFFRENQKEAATDLANEDLSIAVLPLINLNAKDENLEYFSDGVTQEIIDELAHINVFSLTPFTTGFLYKNNSKPYN